VSRVHDALRRGRTPWKAPAPPRSAQADAVLAALGFRSRKRAAGRSVALAGALITTIGVAAGWALWPATPPVEARGVSNIPRVAVPVMATASNPPVATAPQIPGPSAPVAPTLSPPPSSRPRALSVPERKNGPRSPALNPAVRRDDFQLALYHQRAGDFEQAQRHYKAALQRDEMHVEAHNNLGSLYLGKNLLDEAAREFQRVLAIDPEYAPAHINLSAALYKLGRFDAAAAQAREVLRLDPRNGDGFVNLALAQKGAGQHAESQASLRRALELNPRHAVAHYNLARQYEDAAETVRAIEHYRRFLQYAGSEQQPYAVEVRARLLTLQGREPHP
jgi:Tfp pilus assembly protein PilF